MLKEKKEEEKKKNKTADDFLPSFPRSAFLFPSLPEPAHPAGRLFYFFLPAFSRSLAQAFHRVRPLASPSRGASGAAGAPGSGSSVARGFPQKLSQNAARGCRGGTTGGGTCKSTFQADNEGKKKRKRERTVQDDEGVWYVCVFNVPRHP